MYKQGDLVLVNYDGLLCQPAIVIGYEKLSVSEHRCETKEEFLDACLKSDAFIFVQLIPVYLKVSLSETELCLIDTIIPDMISLQLKKGITDTRMVVYKSVRDLHENIDGYSNYVLKNKLNNDDFKERLNCLLDEKSFVEQCYKLFESKNPNLSELNLSEVTKYQAGKVYVFEKKQVYFSLNVCIGLTENCAYFMPIGRYGFYDYEELKDLFTKIRKEMFSCENLVEMYYLSGNKVLKKVKSIHSYDTGFEVVKQKPIGFTRQWKESCFL